MCCLFPFMASSPHNSLSCYFLEILTFIKWTILWDTAYPQFTPCPCPEESHGLKGESDQSWDSEKSEFGTLSLVSPCFLTCSRLKRERDFQITKHILHFVLFWKVRDVVKVIKVVRATAGDICLAGNNTLDKPKQLFRWGNKHTRKILSKYLHNRQICTDEYIWLRR